MQDTLNLSLNERREIRTLTAEKSDKNEKNLHPKDDIHRLYMRNEGRRGLISIEVLVNTTISVVQAKNTYNT